MKSMSALEARKRFGGLLDEVAKEKSHILISRINRPMAVLIPYEDYQQNFDREARRKRLHAAKERMDNLREHHAKKLGGVIAEDAVRQIRDS